MSSSLDSLVKTLVDNNHKTLENLKKEFVGSDEILSIGNQIGEADRSNNDLKKDYPGENERTQKASKKLHV